jgi:hypothetical protein
MTSRSEPVDRENLLQLMRRAKYAVEASASLDGPQAAVIGIVVTDNFEIIFDTLASTRKASNFRRDPRVAFVIGGTHDQADRTVQYEGVAVQPSGAELARVKQLYFSRFPDGVDRERWPGITYFLVRPTWLRYSDFREDPPAIFEFSAAELAALA